jgi:hypothetical protein
VEITLPEKWLMPTHLDFAMPQQVVQAVQQNIFPQVLPSLA